MMKDRSQLVSYLAREEIECEVVFQKKKRQNVRDQKHKAFTSQQNRVIFIFLIHCHHWLNIFLVKLGQHQHYQLAKEEKHNFDLKKKKRSIHLTKKNREAYINNLFARDQNLKENCYFHLLHLFFFPFIFIFFILHHKTAVMHVIKACHLWTLT